MINTLRMTNGSSGKQDYFVLAEKLNVALSFKPLLALKESEDGSNPQMFLGLRMRSAQASRNLENVSELRPSQFQLTSSWPQIDFNDDNVSSSRAVSYTHLTLPTIYSV